MAAKKTKTEEQVKVEKKIVEKVKPVKKENKKVEKPKLTDEEKLKALRGLHLKPIVTEKVVMMIELQNTLKFEEGMLKSKVDIKRAIEELFGVKVEQVRTLIRGSKKYAYVKLNKEFPAIDVATKLGLM